MTLHVWGEAGDVYTPTVASSVVLMRLHEKRCR